MSVARELKLINVMKGGGASRSGRRARRRRLSSSSPSQTTSFNFPWRSAPPLLVLLLLLFEQLVDLPLGHGGVLGDDAVLVEAGQQQQKAH